jgi:hypothetical protein
MAHFRTELCGAGDVNAATSFLVSSQQAGMTTEFVMAQVITKCPLTGHYKFMGINIDEERFAALPEFFARQFCPFCACEHSWLKKDSKLVDRRRAMRRGIQQAS